MGKVIQDQVWCLENPVKTRVRVKQKQVPQRRAPAAFPAYSAPRKLPVGLRHGVFAPLIPQGFKFLGLNLNLDLNSVLLD